MRLLKLTRLLKLILVLVYFFYLIKDLADPSLNAVQNGITGDFRTIMTHIYPAVIQCHTV